MTAEPKPPTIVPPRHIHCYNLQTPHSPMHIFRRNSSMSTSGRYRSMRTISAHRGGVSCVAISHDGTLLASGANDGTKIWKISNGQAFDGPPRRVSAVSTMMWIARTDPDMINIPELLCFGTGRGELAIWQRTGDASFDEILQKTVGNAREITAMACNERGDDDLRIAIGTIDNSVLAFHFDGSELHQVFTRRMDYTTPVALHVIDNPARDVWVIGVYNGGHLLKGDNGREILASCDLGSVVGAAAFDTIRGLIVFDNSIEGYSLHALGDGRPVRQYPTGTPKWTFPRQVIFGENGRVIVGGSENGVVYVFDRRTGSPLDLLRHSGNTEGIALVGTVATHHDEQEGGDLIVSASSCQNHPGVIKVWARVPSSRRSPRWFSALIATLAVAFLVIIAVMCTYEEKCFTRLIKEWRPIRANRLGDDLWASTYGHLQRVMRMTRPEDAIPSQECAAAPPGEDLQPVRRGGRDKGHSSKALEQRKPRDLYQIHGSNAIERAQRV
ncbi:hypothetical protein PLEOSDRAFT_1101234 [Pleurotus ostreatus PC15]|uniref:Uncharacterized protein n=1 Tax=Pleurotus ostreatus (strain PC15) TaxID=1137138 RepID=A0A067NT87_PLEO1|nr:hypothetical protein PLEOSDRAFT_1101234 [Pleurotus ostreatus PC15]